MKGLASFLIQVRMDDWAIEPNPFPDFRPTPHRRKDPIKMRKTCPFPKQTGKETATKREKEGRAFHPPLPIRRKKGV